MAVGSCTSPAILKKVSAVLPAVVVPAPHVPNVTLPLAGASHLSAQGGGRARALAAGRALCAKAAAKQPASRARTPAKPRSRGQRLVTPLPGPGGRAAPEQEAAVGGVHHHIVAQARGEHGLGGQHV